MDLPFDVEEFGTGFRLRVVTLDDGILLTEILDPGHFWIGPGRYPELKAGQELRMIRHPSNEDEFVLEDSKLPWLILHVMDRRLEHYR